MESILCGFYISLICEVTSGMAVARQDPQSEEEASPRQRAKPLTLSGVLPLEEAVKPVDETL